MLPLILILAGAFIYLHAFGLTLVVMPEWSFYWAATLVLLGLLVLLGKR